MLPPIGKYTIERVLGEGGFGKVYLAFDPDVGQPVAIKKLRAAGDPDLLKRFQLEIRTTASLRHKNIVTIHASGEVAGDPYLVMEFLEGHTLKQVIQQRQPLTLLEKVRIMTQVAEGLGYAHSKGVVHRDVKPENIMLLPDDNVKIMDFGIALAPNRNTAVTQTGGIIGTPPYFAPEQLEGLKANEQTDIFSFGDVYYELLTGVHPFEQFKSEWKSLQLAILTYEPVSVGELVPGCPEALELLVHRTLAKVPEFRYQTFEELRLDSEAILVDLRHEGAAAILQEIRPLMDAGDLHAALLKIRQAYQLEPGNREVRRLREEINLWIQKEQVHTRVDELLADAARQMGERRYAEAVQSLEAGVKLDSGNAAIAARLQEAKARLDSANRANRLVSEARLKQQKGLLDDANELFQAALAIDPEHTDAKRLSNRVSDELERRRLEQKRQQAVRSAREHLAAKRFAEAAAILDEIDRDQPGAAGVAELRAEIQHEQAEESRRLRAEKFNLALSRTREAIQAGDLDRAGPMLDHLFANFAAEPGAADVLPDLRQRLNALIRARASAQYQQKARSLLREKSFAEALALLAEALAKYPDDAGLERMHKSAEDLYQAHQRSEAVAAVLRQATTKRAAGDFPGALNIILEARQRLGEEASFVELSGQLEIEIEQQRHNTGLESLLKEGNALLAAGRYSEAIDRIESANEFAGEAEVHALLDTARAAATVELERRFVEETLAAAESLQSQAMWSQALAAVQRGLARYPNSLGLTEAADRLRDHIESERRRSSIDKHRAAICLEIEHREWQRAGEALRKARSEFPSEATFEDLARQVEAGSFDAGLQEVEARVRESLAANAVSRAEQDLDATRTIYANHPRWRVLAQEVARRREYESALLEADRQRNASRLSDAETLLTNIIDQGVPDQRAGQMRDAIRVQRSEAARQAEIARIAEGIRIRLQSDDLVRATSELTAARARYPGEGVWTELQAGIDTRQQSLRRQQEIAAAQDKVRQSLSRDDLRQAEAVLSAARAKYPGEAAWTALEAEIHARRAILTRRNEIAAVTESIRKWLSRDHAADKSVAGSFSDRRRTLLARRQKDLQPAISELDAARAKYPGENAWATLRAEIDARQAFLEREAGLAENVSQCLERNDVPGAQAALAAARSQYPDEAFWGMLQREVAEYEALLQSRAEAARQSLLKRQDELAAIERGIREPLERVARIRKMPELPDPIEQQWDAFQEAAGVLAAARAKYPEEDRWLLLQAEIDSRRAQWKNELAQELSNFVRESRHHETVRRLGPQIRFLRAKDPDELLWARLEAEIEALEGTLKRLAQVAAEGERVRAALRRDNVAGAVAALNAARIGYPGEDLWPALEAEIETRRVQLEAIRATEEQARAQRERKVEEIRQGAEILLTEGKPEEAIALIEGCVAREPRFEELLTHAKQALEQQRRREARDRDRDRLLAIESQLASEPRRRKRRDLNREAHRLAEVYGADEEIAAVAARIHGLVVAAPAAAPGARASAVPKIVAAGLAVASLVLAVVLVPRLFRKSTPHAIPVEITSDPAGASVQLGDRSCVTPYCRFDLLPGKYTVQAQLNGYQPAQQSLTVGPSSVPARLDLTLQPVLQPPTPGRKPTISGTLIVRTETPGAQVFVDNLARGSTDSRGVLTLPLEPKDYDVRVEKSGCQTPPAQRIKIAEGRSQPVGFKLIPQNAKAGRETPPSGPPDLHPQPDKQTQPAQPAQPDPAIAEAKDWDQARASSDPSLVQAYLDTHQNGLHFKEAQAHLDDLIWRNGNDPQAYLDRLPKGVHRAEALQRIADAAWGRVDKTDPQALLAFMAQYPSVHKDDARNILDQLDRLKAENHRLTQEQADRDALHQADVQSIRGTINQFNAAFKKRQPSALRQVWPGAKKVFLDGMKQPGATFVMTLQPTGDPVITGETALVTCLLVSDTTLRGQVIHNQKSVQVALSKTTGLWLISALQ